MTDWNELLQDERWPAVVLGLEDVPLGVLSESNAILISALLGEVSPPEIRPQWVYWPKSDGLYTTAGCTVIYTGPNTPELNMPMTSKNVMIVEFPENAVDPVGRINIYWNEFVPFTDPPPVIIPDDPAILDPEPEPENPDEPPTEEDPPLGNR